MRLTLRTLLAYMDGLLDPKDSQEIGKKIEDSKFATDLFHKIRDVMRRLRLAAPSITERGANLDCNTVAEYLDNAMPGDRVPDFEEVSLKSDMHLAEVASCHQILTMVLGEPAEIDPDSRQRMYQLPTVANRVGEERQAAAEAASVLSADGNGPLPSAAPPVKAPAPPRGARVSPRSAQEVAAPARRGHHAPGRRRDRPARGDVLSASARQWLQAKWDGKPAVEGPRDQHESTGPPGPRATMPPRSRMPLPLDAKTAAVSRLPAIRVKLRIREWGRSNRRRAPARFLAAVRKQRPDRGLRRAPACRPPRPGGADAIGKRVRFHGKIGSGFGHRAQIARGEAPSRRFRGSSAGRSSRGKGRRQRALGGRLAHPACRWKVEGRPLHLGRAGSVVEVRGGHCRLAARSAGGVSRQPAAALVPALLSAAGADPHRRRDAGTGQRHAD